MNTLSTGPLAGLRVLEFAGIGPGPFACMMLSDMGADVISIDRPGATPPDRFTIVGRGRTRITADLKAVPERHQILKLVHRADVVVEGFRPGAMERLGLGPDDLSALNPALVYARMTGWGQDGPLAQAAGHDINYIAITGALAAIGPRDGPPVPPLNLVGDYGGGSLYLVAGILAALHERHRSGKGQTVDAAIVDGVHSLMSNYAGHVQRGSQQERRASNMLDGGAPFYGVYKTADQQFVSIGALESQFFAQLCVLLELPPDLAQLQKQRERWSELEDAFTTAFARQTAEHWTQRLEGTDVCFAPVLPFSDAVRHPHNAARSAFQNIDGVLHPAPAPRFSRTASKIQEIPSGLITTSEDAIARWA